jgi:hypothetical protein
MAKTARGKSTPNPATPVPGEPGVSTRYQPTEDQIALRAYHIYLDRGESDGNPLDDWLQAEHELTEGIEITAVE